MRRLNDPEVVHREYASEDGLAACRAAYANAEGPDALTMVFDAAAEVHPRRVLEVGCGWASSRSACTRSSTPSSLRSTSRNGWSS